MHRVRQTRKLSFTLLDNAKCQHAQVHSNNAASNTLSLALASTTGTVARMAIAEQEANTSRMHDTLLHRKALLVVATRDAKDVAGELRPNAVSRNLGAHAAVHEDTQLTLVFDLDKFLRAIGRI